MDSSLWELFAGWLNTVTVLSLSPAQLIAWTAAVTGFVAAVQGIKKILENLSKWAWLVNLIPGLGKIFDFLAHGIGPVIINALLTGGTLLLAALSDGVLTAGEMLNILLAVIGADVVYRALRAWIFTKRDK